MINGHGSPCPYITKNLFPSLLKRGIRGEFLRTNPEILIITNYSYLN